MTASGYFRAMRFQYPGPMRQTTWRPYGCMGCSPLVGGAFMILVGLLFQTGWAADAATFLLKAIGYLLIGFGGLGILLSLWALLTGRRRGPF